MNSPISIDKRIDQLQAGGVFDMHFDLLLGLHLNRERADVLTTELLPEMETGGVGLLGAAIYVEDRYLETALSVALHQVVLLHANLEKTERVAICKTYDEICRARKLDRIALLMTMEGAEPLGSDLHLLRIFYELGLRAISFTHTRRNAAAAGGIFAASGSPSDGLTDFGRDLVRECEALGIIIDLAHINPAGFDEIFALTRKPLIVSHANARRYYDIERNMSDEQIKMIGERGGVIGINAILVSGQKEHATLDHYVDHIEHVASLIGIDGVGIGFDFCEFIWRALPAAERAEVEAKLTVPYFLPDLAHHAHAPNLTRKLIERGFTDQQIIKILRGNWMRILKELL